MPKTELIDEIWSDAYISDSTFTTAIGEIRHALGDAGATQRLIRTRRGRGYQFVAEVRFVAEVEERRRPGAAELSTDGRPFVGRGPILARLEAALAAVEAGSGRMVFLAGEPGIGKTRTAEEFARRAQVRGVPVYTGWCEESGIAPPYWSWVRLLRTVIEDCPVDSLRADLGGQTVALSRILPELRERWPDLPEPPPLPPEAVRFQLSEGISTLLKRIVSQQPLVLILDDLHRADEPSLGVLSHLAREIAGFPILVVGTYRDVEIDREHPLAETLAELARHDVFERIPLEGLSRDEVEELVRRLVGPDASADLTEAIDSSSDGNPFFATELVRFLAAGEGRGTNERNSLAELRVPPTVREVIVGRLGKLSPSCNEVLNVASVIGRDFDRRLIGSVTDLDPEAVDQALTEARRVGMVARGAVDQRFAHVLTQQAVYGELGTGRRAELHRAVAEAMAKMLAAAALNEQAALMAHHWEQAGDVLEAARWHRRAAEWLGWMSVEGGQHWRTVLQLLEGAPESSEADALALAAMSRLVSNNAIHISVEEIEGLRPNAKRLAEKAGDLQSLWRTEVGYFHHLAYSGPYRTLRAQLDVVLELAERIGDPVIQAQAAIYKAGLGSPLDALTTIEVALAELPAEARDWSEPAVGQKPYYQLRFRKGVYLCSVGRVQEGLEEFERLLRLIPGDGYLALQVHAHASGVARLIGDRSRVHFHRQALQEIAESSGMRHPALGAVGSAQVLDTKPGLAIQTFTEAIELEAPERGAYWLQLRAQLAGAHLLCGNLDEARVAAERAVELAGGFLVIEPCITLARVLRVSESAAAAGEIEAQLRRAKAAIERFGHAVFTPFLSEESAHLARLLGDEGGCERHFREAHRLYTEMGALGHAERVGGGARLVRGAPVSSVHNI